MYFERWGLLAPPPEKSELSQKICLLCFPYEEYYYSTVTEDIQQHSGMCARNCPGSGLDSEDYPHRQKCVNLAQRGNFVESVEQSDPPQ